MFLRQRLHIWTKMVVAFCFVILYVVGSMTDQPIQEEEKILAVPEVRYLVEESLKQEALGNPGKAKVAVDVAEHVLSNRSITHSPASGGPDSVS